MSEAVDHIEDALSEGERNVGTGRAVADVNNNAGLADINRFEVEAGTRIVSQLPELGVQRLLGRDGAPIDAEIADGADDALEVCLSCFTTC